MTTVGQAEVRVGLNTGAVNADLAKLSTKIASVPDLKVGGGAALAGDLAGASDASERLFQTRSALTQQRVSEALEQERSGLIKLAGAATIAATAIAALFAAGTAEFVGFDKAIRQSGVVSGSVGTEALGGLREEIEQLGIATTKTPKDIAETSVALSRAGFSAEETTASLRGIVNASEATGESLLTLGDITAKTLRTFKLDASESTRVSDVLVSAANNSNTTVSQLGEALKYVGPRAFAANQPLEDMAIAIGLVSDSGLQGTATGTALTQVLSRMQQSSASLNTELEQLPPGAQRAGKALGVIGANFRNADGSMKSILEVLPPVRAELAKLSQEDQDLLLKQLFGIDGGNAFQSLLSATPEQVGKLTSAVRDSGGAAAEAGAELKKGLGGSLDLLGGSVATAIAKFGEFAAIGLEPLARGAASVLNAFSALPGPVLFAASAVTAAGGAFLAATALVAGYKLAKIGVIFAELKAGGALVFSTAAQAANTAVTTVATAGQVAYALATGTATAAQSAFVASLATTVGTVGAISGAIAALVAVVDTFNSIKAGGESAAAGIKALDAAEKELQATQGETVATGDKRADQLNKYAESLNPLQKGLDKVRGALGLTTAAQAKQNEAIVKGSDFLSEANQKFSGSINFLNKFKAGNTSAEEVESQVEAIDGYIKAVEGTEAPNEQQAQQQKQLVTQFQKIKTELEASTEATADSGLAQAKATQSVKEYLAGVNDLASGTKELGAASDTTAKSLESLGEKYDILSARAGNAAEAQRAAAAEAYAAGELTKEQFEKKSSTIDQGALKAELAILKRHQAEIAGIRSSDPEVLKKAGADLLKTEGSISKKRTEIAKGQVKEQEAANEAVGKAIEGLGEKYDILSTKAGNAADLQRASAAEAYAAGKITKGQFEEKSFNIDQQSIKSEIEALKRQRIELEKVRTTDPKTLKKAGAELLKIDGSIAKKRIELARGQIDERDKAEKAKTKSLEETAKLEKAAADLGIEYSSDLSQAQIAAIDEQARATEAAREAQVAALKIVAETAQIKSEQVIAGLNAEAKAVESQLAGLDRQQKLNESLLALAKARNDLGQARGSVEVDALTSALDARKKLDSLETKSLQERVGLRKVLAAITGDANAKELDIVIAKQAQEDKLAQIKQQAQQAEFAGQRASLELDLQRNQILLQQAGLQAKIARIQAESRVAQSQSALAELALDPAATDQQLQNARARVDLAQQEVDLAQAGINIIRDNASIQGDLAANARAALNTQQKAAQVTAQGAEAQRRLAQATELAGLGAGKTLKDRIAEQEGINQALGAGSKQAELFAGTIKSRVAEAGKEASRQANATAEAYERAADAYKGLGVKPLSTGGAQTPTPTPLKQDSTGLSELKSIADTLKQQNKLPQVVNIYPQRGPKDGENVEAQVFNALDRVTRGARR